MLRAVKGPEELKRLAAAGAAADATYLEIVELPFEGRLETEVAADLARLLREHGHEQVDFTVVGRVGPPRREPTSRGRPQENPARRHWSWTSVD